jgi:hypothetical protein
VQLPKAKLIIYRTNPPYCCFAQAHLVCFSTLFSFWGFCQEENEKKEKKAAVPRYLFSVLLHALDQTIIFLAYCI